MTEVDLATIRDVLVIFYVVVGIPTMIWRVSKEHYEKKEMEK